MRDLMVQSKSEILLQPFPLFVGTIRNGLPIVYSGITICICSLLHYNIGTESRILSKSLGFLYCLEAIQTVIMSSPIIFIV